MNGSALDRKRVVDERRCHIGTSGVRCENEHVTGAPVTAIADPANSGYQGVCGVFNLARPAIAEQLTHSFHEIGPAASQTDLASRNLSAARIERQVAVEVEVGFADISATLPLGAEAEHFQLQQDRENEIVVRLERANILRLEPGLPEGAFSSDTVASIGHVADASGPMEVRDLAVTDGNDEAIQLLGPGDLPTGDKQPIGAIGGHDAVQQS